MTKRDLQAIIGADARNFRITNCISLSKMAFDLNCTTANITQFEYGNNRNGLMMCYLMQRGWDLPGLLKTLPEIFIDKETDHGEE